MLHLVGILVMILDDKSLPSLRKKKFLPTDGRYPHDILHIDNDNIHQLQ
jgi:hypothetical protein